MELVHLSVPLVPEMVEEEAREIIAEAKQEPVRNQAVKRDPASGLLFIFYMSRVFQA